MLAVFCCVSFSLRLSFRLITRSCESGLFSFLVLARRRESWAPLSFSPLAHFPSSFSSGRNFNSRGYSNAKRASVYFERESDTCPHRARRARIDTPQAADRKYPRTRTHKTRRWKMRCTEVAVVCAPRALHSTHIFHRSRALILARSVGFFFFSHTRPRSFLFCLVLSLLSFALCFCASYLRNPLSHRPSLLTRRFFSLSLRIFLSASLSLLPSSFFLRVVYSRTCQRINIFMKGLQCSLVGLFALDMHVLSRAVLSRAPFVRSLSLFLCLVRYYSLFFY